MRIKRLFYLAKGFGLLFFIVTVLTIFHQFSYSYVPLFTQYLFKVLEQRVIVVDSGLPGFIVNNLHQATSVLNVVLRIAIMLFAFQIIRFTMRFFESMLKGNLRESMTKKVKIELFNHIQDLPYSFHNKSDSGDLIQRVTSDVETSTAFLSQQLIDVVFLLATLFFGSYQLYHIQASIVWITLSLAPIVGVASILYSRKIHQVYRNIEETESDMMTVIQENLSSSKVVRAFANEGYEIEKLAHKNEAYQQAMKKANRLVAVYWGAMDALASVQYLVVIIIGVIQVRKGNMDAADVIAALALVGMLIWPIRGLGRIINGFGRALVASDRIYEILSLESEYVNDGYLEPNIIGKIEFDNVSFKYEDRYVLNKISFTIEAGKTAVFIGKTGSGKSTIVQLLLRMYEPTEGEIRIDGIPLKSIKKRWIRTHMGTVLQEPFLYGKTVYDNIAIANDQATPDMIYQAAHISSMEEDIRSFKEGYQTMIGEKGTTLSGGQRQRVAISRILIAEKPILIFDDALSAVDIQTDRMIRSALETFTKHTTIIITHRIMTAKDADVIFVLENGSVQSSGTHDSLKHQKGLYQTIWNIQGQLEEAFLQSIQGGESHV